MRGRSLSATAAGAPSGAGRLLLLVVALLLPGCVATSSDLRELAFAIRSEMEDATDPRDARERIAEALDAKAAAIEQRAADLAAAAAEKVAPGWGEIVGAAVAVTGAGVAGLNAHRNSTRRRQAAGK